MEASGIIAAYTLEKFACITSIIFDDITTKSAVFCTGYKNYHN